MCWNNCHFPDASYSACLKDDKRGFCDLERTNNLINVGNIMKICLGYDSFKAKQMHIVSSLNSSMAVSLLAGKKSCYKWHVQGRNSGMWKGPRREEYLV